MIFTRDGDILKAVRITGTNHNYLGIKLASDGDESPTSVHAERLNRDPARLAPEDVVECVLHGIEEENLVLGTRYRASQVFFVEGDTPPADAYIKLARSIIFRFHTNPESYSGSE